MFDFCQVYNMSNLIRGYTCYKNPSSCIDLILANKLKSFLRSAVIETGSSDFHKMTLAIIKTHFTKQMPNIVEYCDFKKFSNALFRRDIQENLRPEYIFQKYQTDTIVCNIFNRQAPVNMFNILSKVVMKRSKLRNKYLRQRSNANKLA